MARKGKLEKYSAADRNKNRIAATDVDRYCGNCICFHDEDADGRGFCHEHACEKKCDEVCNRCDF